MAVAVEALNPAVSTSSRPPAWWLLDQIERDPLVTPDSRARLRAWLTGAPASGFAPCPRPRRQRA
jgi:hypothetical protein